MPIALYLIKRGRGRLRVAAKHGPKRLLFRREEMKTTDPLTCSIDRVSLNELRAETANSVPCEDAKTLSSPLPHRRQSAGIFAAHRGHLQPTGL